MHTVVIVSARMTLIVRVKATANAVDVGEETIVITPIIIITITLVITLGAVPTTFAIIIRIASVFSLCQ